MLSGPWNIISGSRVWSPIWASSHLREALSGVIGLVRLPLVKGGRVIEVIQQLPEDVLVAKVPASWLLVLLHARSSQGEASG